MFSSEFFSQLHRWGCCISAQRQWVTSAALFLLLSIILLIFSLIPLDSSDAGEWRCRQWMHQSSGATKWRKTKSCSRLLYHYVEKVSWSFLLSSNLTFILFRVQSVFHVFGPGRLVIRVCPLWHLWSHCQKSMWSTFLSLLNWRCPQVASCRKFSPSRLKSTIGLLIPRRWNSPWTTLIASCLLDISW